jgi:transposase
MLSIPQLEARRLEAARLLRTGLSRAAVAARLGVTWQAVAGWDRRVREQGLEGLQSSRLGRPSVERFLSDSNPVGALGEDFNVETDPRATFERHPVEDMEPEADSPAALFGRFLRRVHAWELGKSRLHVRSVGLRAVAKSLVLSHELVTDTRIQSVAKRCGVTKQALCRQMNAFRDECLRDFPFRMAYHRSDEAREAMREAAVNWHRKRRG